MRFKTLLFFIFFLCIKLYAQNNDSIYKKIYNLSNDSIKWIEINSKVIAPLLNKKEFVKVENILKDFVKFTQNKNNYYRYKHIQIELLFNQEKYDQVTDSITHYLNILNKEKNFYFLALFARKKAIVQLKLGDYKQSINNYFYALSNAQKTNDKKLIFLLYSDIATISFFTLQYKQAIDYWEKSIVMQLKEKENFLVNDYSNLSMAYLEINELIKAEEALNKAFDIAKKENNLPALANIYINYTKIEYSKGNIKQAIAYSNLAAEYYLSISNYEKLSTIYANNAELCRVNKEYKSALMFINKAFNALNFSTDKTSLYYLYYNRSAIYYDLKDYKASHDELMLYTTIKDSLLNEENLKTIQGLEKKYQLSERKKENQLLNEKVKSQSIASSRMRIIIGFISVFLLMFLVFSIYIVKQNKAKTKTNLELNDKNRIINEQIEVVEEQHRQITDSIKYAERIQGAILPPRNFWQKILPNSFVLYKPKDVLSGDFYWIEETKDYIFVAAADCTGHGVPGALISIVNFNLLNKAVLEKNLNNPADILNAVNLWLTDSLHQTYRESSVKDGMDVALISINKHTKEILFAGANNPIYVVSNNELKQIKADKFPVGAFVDEQMQHFSSQVVSVNSGDHIYLFSDGYADQFGGPKGKKYKYATFKKKLTEVSLLDLNEQRSKMKNEFINWKGNLEQVDDVLLIGIKII